MMDIIVFTNKNAGYRLYNKTPSFPDGFEAAILNICNNISTATADEAFGIRYSPVNGRFLLTAIFHGCISDEEKRAHNTAVNFLLNEEEATALFSHPFSAVAREVRRVSEQIIATESEVLHPIPVSVLIKSKGRGRSKTETGTTETLSSLLCGALADINREQVFFACTEPEEKLEMLLSVLPLNLRRSLSFHTNVLSASDSSGISLSLCSYSSIENLKATGFVGGDLSTKIIFSESDPALNSEIKPDICRKLAYLTRDKRKLLDALTETEADTELYIQLAEYISAPLPTNESVNGIIELLGEQRAADAVYNGSFPTEWLPLVAREYRNARKYPMLARAVRSFGDKHRVTSEQYKKDSKKRNIPLEVRPNTVSQNKKSKEKGKLLERVVLLISGVGAGIIAAVIIVALMKAALSSFFDPASGILSVDLSIGALGYIAHTVIIGTVCTITGFFLERVLRKLKK